MPRPLRQAAFTLIEMMVTIAILGIVLVIAVPNLNDYIARTHVKGVADNLAQDLVFARSEATRLNKTVRLTVDSGCYGLTTANSACNCSTAGSCELRQAGNFPHGITLSKPGNGSNTIAFDDDISFDAARGLPVEGSSILPGDQLIAVTGRDSLRATVRMSVLGSVCIYSKAEDGAKRLSGYPDAC
ncbi:GspH/FimT family pseudopilin [Chitinilyticum litopenaei]|uniref:GspH/FimT family pseudopilin n=1 Tax=Chitinilyticum litopenaei TaxID=1121276 RepID=UPI000408851A|nr:GspH/FimT family pseudopilin [Chitinilyticum litopenaei]